MVMMWALASVYLSFFYPESYVMRDLFRFEMGDITEKRKHRIIKIYYRMVQRHLYALGEYTNKRFLSKKLRTTIKSKPILLEPWDPLGLLAKKRLKGGKTLKNREKLK